MLGYLDPAYFAGGTIPLKPELAHQVIEETIARPLGMSVKEAAFGIHQIANAHMADGIRLVSVNRGYDPREFTLVPIGGAGGLHATALAAELEIRRILVPRYPGIWLRPGCSLLRLPTKRLVRSIHRSNPPTLERSARFSQSLMPVPKS